MIEGPRLPEMVLQVPPGLNRLSPKWGMITTSVYSRGCYRHSGIREPEREAPQCRARPAGHAGQARPRAWGLPQQPSAPHRRGGRAHKRLLTGGTHKGSFGMRHVGQVGSEEGGSGGLMARRVHSPSSPADEEAPAGHGGGASYRNCPDLCPPPLSTQPTSTGMCISHYNFKFPRNFCGVIYAFRAF